MAKEHPRYANTEWPDPEFQDYPRMVYPGGLDSKVPAAQVKRLLPGAKPGPNQGVIVNDPEEERIVMAGGVIVREGDEKAELLNRAERLGARVDKRWGVEKLREVVEAAETEAVSG